MAVSNSTDFNLTGVDIVKEARALLGIEAAEEALQAHELTTGLRALNLMLKEWETDGVVISTLTEGQLSLVQSQESYDFGAGGDFTTIPFEITSIRINRGGNDVPMFEMSRDEYFDLPNKTSEGYPTQWYYDRQRAGGKLYVWPSPDVTAGTLKFTYRRIIMDVDSGPNDIDLPQEYLQAVTYGLAVKLMPRYGGAGTPEAQLVIAGAQRSYDIVKTFDTSVGKGSIFIRPDGC